MSGSDRPEQMVNDGVEADAQPACMALVPMVQAAQGSRTGVQPLPRPSSIFVTHLIATANQAPQTRGLRRATAADAQTAYGVNRRPILGAGFRTRQIA